MISCFVFLTLVVALEQVQSQWNVPDLPYNSVDDALAALQGKDLSQYDPVNVTIYFESRCPDSRDFIMGQVYPTVTRNTIPSELYVLHFVPYGNAYTTHDDVANKYTFTCQHGNDECTGNIAEVCYDYVVRNATQTLFYINCVFQQTDNGYMAAYASTVCSRTWLPSSMSESWNYCKTSAGPALHAHMGERTNALNPAHNFIPWTTFDSNGSIDINNQALYHFSDLVVKYWFAKNRL